MILIDTIFICIHGHFLFSVRFDIFPKYLAGSFEAISIPANYLSDRCFCFKIFAGVLHDQCPLDDGSSSVCERFVFHISSNIFNCPVDLYCVCHYILGGPAGRSGLRQYAKSVNSL